MRPSSLPSCLVMIALLAFSTVTQAGPLTDSCVVGPQPAASLLLPYFEVDLEDTNGATTLMSIGNRSEEPTLARVVLWSDWAIPVYAFDLYLPIGGVQTLNLRDVVGRGNIPETGGDMEPTGDCTAPLSNPPLDASALAELHAQLTGKPSTVDGMCWGSDRGETSVAVGYVTVDVLKDCSNTVRYPSDEGYFAEDGSGLVAFDNVLYGDWFLINPSQDLAQGAELVHLVADPEFFENIPVPSFYRLFTPNSKADGRIPLSAQWQTRFLNGGGFDGGTELLLWLEPVVPSTPLTCGESPFDDFPLAQFFLTVRNEAGLPFPDVTLPSLAEGDAFVRRVRIEEASLPDGLTSGLLELASYEVCGICGPPILGPLQSWVTPLFSAANRFSVGTGAIRLHDPCAFAFP